MNGPITPGLSIPPDKHSLNGTPIFVCSIDGVPVPDCAIVDDDRSFGAKSELLARIVCRGIGQVFASNVCRKMRAGYEPRSAVICAKLINHNDESYGDGAALLALQVGVKRLCFRGWPKRSGEHRSEFERLSDKPMTRREQWTEEIERIELDPTIDKVMESRRCAADSHVIGMRR
jgi:hypothetical protein